MDDDVEDVRRRAQQGIADVTVMLVDGDAIEQLARAHERHADRLEAARALLTDVGITNYLGDTSEGRTATANYRKSAVTGEESLSASILQQAAVSRRIAELLRSTDQRITDTDTDGARRIRS